MKRGMKTAIALLMAAILLAPAAWAGEDWNWFSVQTQPKAPQKRLTGVVIGIDPGHQMHQNSERETISPYSSETKIKVSSGTSGVTSGVDEYVVNLQVGLKLQALLTEQGATVYMTRMTNDVDISNQERAKMMNDRGAQLVLRLHCDGVDSRSVHGISMYVNETGPIADSSYSAAQSLLTAMVEYTGARDAGIHTSDSYTGNNWSEVPCILVEMGFMSNPDEDLKLVSDSYQNKLAEGMLEGIARWFGR